MKRLVLLLFIALCLAIGSQPLAATDAQTEWGIQGVRDTFAALQQAYATEDVDLFLSCHEPLVAQFDRPRDEMFIVRKEVAREEISALFAMLDGMRMEFFNLEIAVEGDTAVARTLRRGTAIGLLEASYCRMAFTLHKGNGSWDSQKWCFANYTIYDEWTELVEDPDSTPSIQGFATAPRTGKRKSMFF